MQPPLSTEPSYFNKRFPRVESPDGVRRVTYQYCFNSNSFLNSFFVRSFKSSDKLTTIRWEKDRNRNERDARAGTEMVLVEAETRDGD
jgi:hypothetical protein